MLGLVERPETVGRVMTQMTRLWKEVVDTVSSVVLPAGQGTTNWTSGWSARCFVCIGQNDFSCLVGPRMFDEFILADTVACCRHVDRIIYHLDGLDALRHLDRILGIDALHCMQWIQGADADFGKEMDALCGALDPSRLFVVASVPDIDQARFILRRAREARARR
jgi:hypothetical protein